MKSDRLVIRTVEMHAVAVLILASVIALSRLLDADDVNYFQVLIWILSLYAGFSLSLLLLSRKSRFPVKLLLYGSLPLLLIVASCLTGRDTISKLVIAAGTVLFYYTGLRSGIVPVYSILDRKIIYTGAISFSVLLILASYLERLGGLLTVMTILASVFGILTLVLLNQKTLDYNIYLKRGIDAGGIQHKLRMYNVNTVIVLVLAAVLLFNIRDIVIELYRLAALATGYLIYFILFVISFLFPGGDTSRTPSQNPAQLPFTDEEGGSSIVSVILTVLVSALFAVVIWKSALPAWRALVSSLKSLSGRLKTFFCSLFSINEAQKTKFLKKEYVDHVEFIRDSPKQLIKKRRSDISIKALKSIDDPIRKIRYAYRCFIYSVHGLINIEKSDTAREILHKYKCCQINTRDVCSLTYEYEKARYGGIRPSDKTLMEIENLLHVISKKANRPVV